MIAFVIVALSVFELWLWAIGIETPERGSSKRWIGLIGSIVFLGVIILVLALLGYERIVKSFRKKRGKRGDC